MGGWELHFYIFYVVFHVVANFRRMGVKILEDERLRINGVVKSD